LKLEDFSTKVFSNQFIFYNTNKIEADVIPEYVFMNYGDCPSELSLSNVQDAITTWAVGTKSPTPSST
jgi:hypothetical protein